MTNRTEVKRMFGSFWNSVWDDPDLYNALVTQAEFMFGQLRADAARLEDFVNRFDVPVKRRRDVKVSQVDELSLKRKYVTLGSFTMDQGQKLDQLQHNPPVWMVESPVESCEVITDSPVNPQIMLLRGTHFDIVDGQLMLYVDPFKSEFAQQLIVVDEEEVLLTNLWFVHTEEDKRYLPEHYGRVIGMITPSSVYYKRILNAIYDLLQEGTTVARVGEFIGSILDTDVARTDGTVTAVWDEGSRSWVEIDGKLHSCPGTGNAIVSVEDTVQTGDLLFNTFTITPGDQEVDPGNFPSIVLGRSYISTTSKYGLTFENAEFEVETYRFPIGGDPDDVDAFWANAEAEAEIRGIDLHDAILGDKRTPFTVNPFEFIRANFLAASTVFVTVDLSAVPDTEAIKLLRYLDAVTPASTTYLLNAFTSVDGENDVNPQSDGAEPFYANDADELDNITITDYIKGNEKLY